MIERFNFYDLYGYFIPGVALLGLLWMPFGIVLGHWPPSDLGSLAGIVILAYIVGYFLQSIATLAISSSEGKRGFPSSFLLDPGDPGLSAALKARIEQMAQNWFGIAVGVDRAADAPLARARQDAFLLARLIGNQSGKYGEQFEGLYSMMRGLLVAFGLAAFATAGWALAALPVELSTLALGALVVGFVLALGCSIAHVAGAKDDATLNRFTLYGLALAFAGAGYALGSGALGTLTGAVAVNPERARILWGAAALYALAAVRFFSAYRACELQFAKAVWQQFAAGSLERSK